MLPAHVGNMLPTKCRKISYTMSQEYKIDHIFTVLSLLLMYVQECFLHFTADVVLVQEISYTCRTSAGKFPTLAYACRTSVGKFPTLAYT